jgi:hypothetical protein
LFTAAESAVPLGGPARLGAGIPKVIAGRPNKRHGAVDSHRFSRVFNEINSLADIFEPTHNQMYKGLRPFFVLGSCSD